MNKKIMAIVVAAVLIGGVFVFLGMREETMPVTGNIILESAPVDDLYSMFLCPCCGEVLDKENICCGMAEEMIKFIDSQLASGLSKNKVVIKAAEKYGMNSVIESKRSAVREALASQNPSAFPTSKISFRQAAGKTAPDFELGSISGETVKLSDYRGKNVVLFFNEGSMCYPACWDQMAALGNDARFDTDDTIAFSVLVDQKTEWEQIVREVPKLAKAKILFDSTRGVSSAYDVLSLQSSMHPGNFPGHTFFIIDREGIIRYTLDDPSMAIRNDLLASQLGNLG